MEVIIKNNGKNILGKIIIADGGFRFSIFDPALRKLIEEAELNGIPFLSYDRGLMRIKRTDRNFLPVLADFLVKEGFIVDSWNGYREEIMAEIEKYPEDDFIKEIRENLDDMNKLQLTYLLELLRS